MSERAFPKAVFNLLAELSFPSGPNMEADDGCVPTVRCQFAVVVVEVVVYVPLSLMMPE